MNFRWIPDIPVDRAKVRTTLTYQVTPDLRLGLEYNPQADDLGLLANWRVVEETRRRPAIILGTSSARIGTEEGRAPATYTAPWCATRPGGRRRTSTTASTCTTC